VSAIGILAVKNPYGLPAELEGLNQGEQEAIAELQA